MPEIIRCPVEIPVEARKSSATLGRIYRPPIYAFEWEGKRYFLKCVSTRQISERWFKEYASIAPHCQTCTRIIFPGQPVEKRQGFDHFSEECIRGSGRLAGHIGYNGKLVPSTPDEVFP